MSNYSINNRLILETYKKDGLQATVSKGFASVQQKVSLKGLKVLMDAQIVLHGTMQFIPAGSTAYIKEEKLHSSEWALKPLRCDTLPMEFIVVDATHVDFVAPPPGDVA